MNQVFSISDDQKFEAPACDPNGISLVPALLPTERPVTGLSKNWSRFPQDHPAPPTSGNSQNVPTVTHVDRFYHFSLLMTCGCVLARRNFFGEVPCGGH